MVATTSLNSSEAAATWTARADTADAVVVPDTSLMFTGDYARIGHDLLINGEGNTSFRVADFFKHQTTPDLVSIDGARLDGHTVELLAGPAFPGQYAQAGATPSAAAIGQVETIGGSASVQRADGTVEPLAVGTKVFQNDVVSTAEGSSLSVTFVDGTIFTLSADARMVLNEMVFDPASQNNSAVFNLVEGSFVFIAGQVAGSGGMEVNTPVATMGIRGTTVKVDIETVNGVTTVDVSLNRDPDGGIGAITLTDLSGNTIANITTTDTKWIVSPVDGETREIARTTAELSDDQTALDRAINAFQSAIGRVQGGDQFVTPDRANQPGEEQNQGPDQQTQPEGNDEQPAPPEGENGEGPEGDTPPEQRGDLGSGIETASATETLTDIQNGGDQSTKDLGDNSGFDGPQGTVGALPHDGSPQRQAQSGGPQRREEEAPQQFNQTSTERQSEVADSAPQIILPNLTTAVQEDGAIALNGFNISDPNGGILTATLTAGSTVSIAPGSGVTIVSGTGTDDEQLVLQGTAEQLTTALNSITYKPSENADDKGSLTVVVTDGTFTTSAELSVEIDPVQDAPSAVDDAISRTENSNPFLGNVLLNDTDPDINPTPDALSLTQVVYNDGSSEPPTITFGNTFTLSSGGSLTFFENGQYTFDPGTAYDALAVGDSITEILDYQITDTGANLDNASLAITIVGTNDAPVITSGSSFSVVEGQSTTITLAELNATDIDSPDPSLTFTLIDAPARGQLENVSAPGTAITSFTLADISAGSIRYVHDGSENSSDAFRYQVSDGIDAVSSTIGISVSGVNDAPSGSGIPAQATFTEDTTDGLDLRGISFTDVDAGSGTLTVTLEANSGLLYTSGSSGVSFTGSGTNTLTLTGQLSALNSYFTASGTVSYQPPAGVFGTGLDSVSVAINDLGNSGTGGPLITNLGSVSIDIVEQNDPPSVSTSNPDSIGEGTAPTVTNVSFDMVDFLTASDPDPADTPAIDAGSLSIAATSGSALTDTSFITITGTTVSFDSANYDPLQDGEQAQLIVSFNVVSGPDTVPASVQITITGTNDTPIISGDLALAVNEGGSVVLTTSDFSASDVDSSDANLLYEVRVSPANGQLELTSAPGTEILTFTTAQLAANQVVYKHNGSSTTLDAITVFVADNYEATTSATINVAIGAVNDDPTASGIPASVTINEDISTQLNLSSITIADVDAGSAPIVVTLNASIGSLSASSNSTVTVGGTATSLTLTGSVANINAYLDNFTAPEISYQGPADANGSAAATIQVVLNDQGNTGIGGGADVIVGNIDVNINAINDNPEATGLPGSLTFTEDTPRAFELSGLVISDVDAGTSNITASLKTNGGTLSGTSNLGVTVNQVSAEEIELVGTVANINTYIATSGQMIYQGASNVSGLSSDSITLTLNDNGNTGAGGGSDVVVGSINVHINAVNDAPSINGLPTSLPFTEDVANQFFSLTTNLDLDDVDNTNLEVRLSVNDGSLSATSNGVITPTTDGAEIVLAGTIGQLENYLRNTGNLTYSPQADDAGVDADRLTIKVSDGSGSITTNVKINIAGVNDAPIITVQSDGADIVTNGGFESGPDSPPGILVSAGNDAIAAWTIESGSVDHVQGYWKSATGDNSIDLYGNAPGIVSTSLTTVVGQAYIVSFDMAGDPFNGETVKDVRASATGSGNAISADFSYDSTGQTRAGLVWESKTFSFIADDTTTTIRFEGLDAASNSGPGLDNVKVVSAAYAAVEDTASVLSGITIADVDSEEATITFTTQNGILTFDQTVTGGLEGGDITGNGTATVTVVAKLAQINATLAAANGLTFLGSSNFSGVTTLNIAVDDNGNTGAGGNQTASQTIQIAVTPVNDAPSGIDEDSLTGAITETLDGSTGENATLHEVKIVDLKYADPDGASPTVNITPLSTNPAITFPITFRTEVDDSDPSRIIVEVYAQVQDASIDYLGAGETIKLEYNLAIDDNRGGVTPVTATSTLTIEGTNDAPVVSAVTNPGAFTEGDQGTVNIQTIDLNSLLTFTDSDGIDTPAIDPNSIVITDAPTSVSSGSAAFFIIDGTNVSIDLGLQDVLKNEEVAIYNVDFNVVSGTDIVARQAQISITGLTDNTINIVEGTANGETLNGSAANDLIVGRGSATNSGEFLVGNDGDDVLLGSDSGGEGFDGGAGNDTIIVGNATSNGDYVLGSSGNDRIMYGGNITGYHSLVYTNLTAAITLTLNSPNNTATVNKGVNGTDTLIDIDKVLKNDFASEGFGVEGTAYNDVFNISNQDAFLQIRGGMGNDTYNILSGYIRLDYLNQPNATTGINANLATGTVSNDSSGGTDTITGTHAVREVRGTDMTDTIIGSAADESFITRLGSDTIDGGDGFDRIRYERNGVASVDVDLTAGSAKGYWNGIGFNQSLTNVEWVRGSKLGVDFLLGSGANEKLEGYAGTDFIVGRGGDDQLSGGSQADVFIFGPGSGLDTITDFVIGTDIIDLSGYGFTSTADFLSFSYTGKDTFVQMSTTEHILVEGVNLTTAAASDIFIFNSVAGTTSGETLNGTAGNDYIFANDGDDRVYGGDGRDVLISGESNQSRLGDVDALFGGAGDDILVASQNSYTILAGQQGNDVITVVNVVDSNDETKWFEGHTLTYSDAPSGIVANLTGSTVAGIASGTVSDGYGTTDTVQGIQNIKDSQFNDTFYIDSTLINKHGSNRVEVQLTDGNDSVDFMTSSQGRISYQHAEDGVIANLTTGTATDIDLSNGDQIGSDTFVNANRLKGSNYDDQLSGGAGSQTFQGRGGNDTIDGGADMDWVGYWGTRSAIQIDFNLTTGQVIRDGRGGTDTLSNIEGVAGSLFDDRIFGSTFNVNFDGYAGSDILIGGSGNDYIRGDYNSGAAGLRGGSDFLKGGAGSDILVGGVDGDIFYFSQGDQSINIADFSIAQNDRIDVSSFGFSNTGDFSSITFDGNKTIIVVTGAGTSGPAQQIEIANFDLTTYATPEDLFIFDVISANTTGSAGTTGDDYIRVGNFNSMNVNGVLVSAQAGNDIIDLTLSGNGFQQISYNGSSPQPIKVTIDGTSNHGSVDKGTLGIDTLFNVITPLQQGFVGDTGGLQIYGTPGADVFNLNGGEYTWVSIVGIGGNDSYDIDSGLVRINYGGGTAGIIANLQAGTINDGLGGTANITGAKGAWEVFGTNFVDTFTGSARDESFITGGGNDTVDGGDGFDRVRYNRSQNGTDDVTADLNTGTINATWNGTAKTDSVSNVEHIQTGGGNDTITGTSAKERFDTADGNDTVTGGGGADIINAGAGDDTVIVPDFDYEKVTGGLGGNDTLVIQGGGQTIDFTNLSLMIDAPQTIGFENFDMGSGDGSTEVTINEQNIRNISSDANDTILAQLGNGDDAVLVNGDGLDKINLKESGDIASATWQIDTGAVITGYDVWQYTDGASTFARLVVDDDIVVTS